MFVDLLVRVRSLKNRRSILLGAYLDRILTRLYLFNEYAYKKGSGYVGKIADQKACETNSDRKS